MIAIDTNIVVRYVAFDDPDQSPRAQALVDGEDVFVSATVILEAGWVLASRHGFSPADVAASLRAFLGLPTVSVDDPITLKLALEWVSSGLGFADAMHLSHAQTKAEFATFDRKLARTGTGLSRVPIRLA